MNDLELIVFDDGLIMISPNYFSHHLLLTGRKYFYIAVFAVSYECASSLPSTDEWIKPDTTRTQRESLSTFLKSLSACSKDAQMARREEVSSQTNSDRRRNRATKGRWRETECKNEKQSSSAVPLLIPLLSWQLFGDGRRTRHGDSAGHHPSPSRTALL